MNKKSLLLIILAVGAMLLLTSCDFSGEWEISRNGRAVARIPEILDLRGEEDVGETVVEEPAVVEEVEVDEAILEEVVFSADHITWSIYGEPMFIVNDGEITEVGADLFTDSSQGALNVNITPSEQVCLLQYGVEVLFSEPFQASFEAFDNGAGFRVISKSHWDSLPESDDAFELCWERLNVDPSPIALWEVYGEPMFIVNDGENTEVGADLFTNPRKGDLTLKITPSEQVCLLQYGVTQLFSEPFQASFEAEDNGAGFRVISKSHWDSLPESDGAFNLCWNRRQP